MKKLSLLLALLMVVSCFVLASCGDEETTSEPATSTATSSAAADESTPATEESTPATEESTPATEESTPATEESTPDAETSEPETEEPAPTVESTEGVTPSGDNLALDATLSGVDVNVVSPQYNACLNDGVASPTISYDGQWFGFYENGDPSKSNAPGRLAVIVIDLGEAKEIIAARINTFLGNTSGIANPTGFTFEFSVDGENYTIFGEKALERVSEGSTVDWVGFTMTEAVSAQYVRITMNMGEVNAWCFVNEVEVY